MSDWRVVEGDLHDIARRVQEYDPATRLVRQDGSGHLGLAVEQKRGLRRFLMLAKPLYDLTTDQPLTGAPDARVLSIQRASDGRRLDKQGWRDWNRALDLQERKAELRGRKATEDFDGDSAEQFAFHWRTQTTHRPRAFVGKGLSREVAA